MSENRPILDIQSNLCYKIGMKKIFLIIMRERAKQKFNFCFRASELQRLCLVMLIGFLISSNAFAAEGINLEKMPKEQIELSKTPKVLKGSLLIGDDQLLDELIKLQKQKDLEDIESLWKGTVANNKVIEFALKKLSTPESQRRIHSSLMGKTLSAIISGSSLAPSFMGADPLIRTGSFAAGRIAQILLNKKTTPQEVPLTDTE